MLALPAGFLCSNNSAATSKAGQSSGNGSGRGGMNTSSSNYLFDKIFSRPPMSIIREALTMLSDKVRSADASLSSQPTSDADLAAASSSLNMDQINIAIKQLKLEFLARGRPDLSSPLVDKEDLPDDCDDSEAEKKSSEVTTELCWCRFRLPCVVTYIHSHFHVLPVHTFSRMH